MEWIHASDRVEHGELEVCPFPRTRLFLTRLGTRVGRTVWNVFPHFHFFRCTFGNCVAFCVIVFSKLPHSSLLLIFQSEC